MLSGVAFSTVGAVVFFLLFYATKPTESIAKHNAETFMFINSPFFV